MCLYLENAHARSAQPFLRSFVIHQRGGLRFCGGVLVALAWLAISGAQAQTTTCVLGTPLLVVGPAAGTNSVVLGVTPATSAWTATNNATWLHLSPSNQSGTGSTNVIFTYDANAGATRSNTLTIGNQTLTVMQAGSTYAASVFETTLAILPPQLPYTNTQVDDPNGVIVDGANNVYIANFNSLLEWVAASNTVVVVASPLSYPHALAMDGFGNVYIADTGANSIMEWSPGSNNLTTLISAGVTNPYGVAVDGAGNFYIANSGSAIEKLTATSNTLTTFLSLTGGILNGMSVDAAGNIYIANSGTTNLVLEWISANSNLVTLVSGQFPTYDTAVDGSGNVYIAARNAIYELSAANNILSTLLSVPMTNAHPFTFNSPYGVAVDNAGNVYIADSGNNAVRELTRALVDPTLKLESNAGGNDSLPSVLPVSQNLLGLFAPISSNPWLTITGVTNGVVSFSFAANTGTNRLAYIALLDQIVPVLQGGPNYALGATALLEGPSAGSDSVVLAVVPATSAWTNTANATWLHLSMANQNGAGSTNVIFTFDANPGATRSGTLTIGDQTLTVTQAGSTYVAAGALTTLVADANGLGRFGLAVDSSGNVYFQNEFGGAIDKWTRSNNTYAIFLTGAQLPGSALTGIAVDGAGNIYMTAESGTLSEWVTATSNLTTLVSSGLSGISYGLAADSLGNIYIADNGSNAIKKWTAANSTLTTLISLPPGEPVAVAVDRSGNVYFDGVIGTVPSVVKWSAANNTLTPLVSGTLAFPFGLAVDGSGNVYFCEPGSVNEWTPSGNVVTNSVSEGGLAVDGMGNVYINTGAAIQEQPFAFVDPTQKVELGVAGSDSLPAVLPTTANLLAPFAPTSDQSWLTITGITNDVVSFSFPANPGVPRIGYISLLGQSIPVTEVVLGPPLILAALPTQANGVFQFAFGDTQNTSFTVLSATNLSLPLSNWTVVGSASNIGPDLFQFTDPQATNTQRFYSVRSP